MLIRAFLWGNDLKAFPLLKSAIFAFPHECHLKPTTTTTTWNSKQKLKSAIFCFFYQSFFKKPPVLPWTLRDFRKPTSPPLNLKRSSKTHQSSLTLKGGSTSHLGLLPSGKKRKPLLLVARNHFILRLADHQRSTPAAELRFFVRGWTRFHSRIC